MGTTRCAFVFDVDPLHNTARIVPSLKDKGVDEDVYEDRALTTPFSLSLSDGVGGTYFPSSHLADLIVHSTTEAIVNSTVDQRKDESLDFLFNSLIGITEKYSVIASETAKHFENTLKGDNSINTQQLRELLNDQTQLTTQLCGAGTFLNAYIEDPNAESPVVRINQMGDSLALVFKPQYIDEEQGTKIYLPQFITADKQKSFNTPTQLSSCQKLVFTYAIHRQCPKDGYLQDDFLNHAIKRYLQDNTVSVRFEASTDDLILLGSDGLFDNIPIPLLSIFVNYLMKTAESFAENSFESIPTAETILFELVDDYYNMAKEFENEFVEKLKAIIRESNENRSILLPIATDNAVCLYYEEFYTKIMNTPLRQRRSNVSDLSGSFVNKQSNSSFKSQSSMKRSKKMIFSVNDDIESFNIQASLNSTPIIPAYHEDDFDIDGTRNTVKGEGKGRERHSTIRYNLLPIDISKETGKQNDSLNFISSGAKKFVNKNSSSEHKFNKRLLPTTILSTSMCSMDDIIPFNPTNDEDNFHNIVLSQCIQNILMKLAVKKNHMASFGYDTMNTALVMAANKISEYSDLKVSPFALRAAEFGESKPEVKEDDIAVIVAAIKDNKSNEDQESRMMFNTEDRIINNLKSDVKSYLTNKFKQNRILI